MRTLILLKPDAVRRHLAGEILARIERKGYTIDSLKMLTASAGLTRRPLCRACGQAVLRFDGRLHELGPDRRRRDFG